MIVFSAFHFTALILFGCNGDDNSTNNGSDGKITLNTTETTMLVESQRVFHATVENLTNTDVNWSTSPASGAGTITGQSSNFIIYTAPANVMTVKLIAVSAEDANLKAEATINVVNQMPQTEVIFYNGNIAGVQSGPQNPTEFTVDSEWTLTYMFNYHYFNNGILPGKIGLKHEDGTEYGPWQCVGRVGQGNVVNAYWDCYPNVTIKPGKYTVTDSDPDTWSHNSGSNYCGFTHVEGIKK